MFLSRIRGSLRLRLLASLLIAVGASLALFLVIVDSIVDRQVESSLDDRLRERANAIASELAARSADARHLLPLRANLSDPVYFEVRDLEGRVLGNSGFDGALNLPSSLTAPAAVDLRLPDGTLARAVLVRSHRIDAMPSDDLYVVVAESRKQTDELNDMLDFILWVGVVIILGICSLVAVVTIKQGLRPLEKVGAAAAAISVQQPQTALPLAGVPREIQPLGEQFNRLLSRLSDALDRERGFSENLAHELRTPLAEMRTLSDVSLLSGSESELRKSVGEIGAAAVRMQSVVETLLAVGRATRQSAANAAEPLDLARLVRTCLKARASPQRGSAVVVNERLPQEVWVSADAQLLEIVLKNLIDNAIRHSTPDHTIEIDWTDDALWIRNPAENLQRADLAFLGTRWWRHPSAGEPTGAKGSGLGLSIATMLVDVLNLSMTFDVDQQRRLSVMLAGFNFVPDGADPPDARDGD